MSAKEFFKSLVGLDISEACKKLGYWWTLTHCSINYTTGFYNFERAAGGYLELRTENNKVTMEHHNGLAEIYQKRDIQ